MMVGQGISSSTLRDVEFTGNATETRAPVDVNCVGTCAMDEIVLSGVQRGLALSGTGAHHLNEVSISATLQALEATGAGHLELSNTTLSADDSVLSVQTPTSTFATVNVSTASSDATGVDVLGGVHAWSDVVLSKPFTSADRSSLGLSAWYADLTVDHLTVRNFSTSADFLMIHRFALKPSKPTLGAQQVYPGRFCLQLTKPHDRCSRTRRGDARHVHSPPLFVDGATARYTPAFGRRGRSRCVIVFSGQHCPVQCGCIR